MRAWIVTEAGGPENLSLVNVQGSKPSIGEVSIKVRGFGINQADLARRRGEMGDVGRSVVLGIEAVGEIIDDPAGVWKVGTPVATVMGGMQFDRPGSYAEQVVVLSSTVVSLEGINLPWSELAALPEATLTAWGAITEALKLHNGDKLFVRGGSTSIGLAAISVAEMLGIEVIASTRNPEHKERLLRQGASKVVIESASLVEDVLTAAPGGVDGALDIVGGAGFVDTAQVVRELGSVSVVGLLAGQPLAKSLNLMMDLPRGVSVGFFPSQVLGTTINLKDAPLIRYGQAVQHGVIPSIVTDKFDFESVPDAHRAMESGRAPGKVVVEVDYDS